MITWFYVTGTDVHKVSEDNSSLDMSMWGDVEAPAIPHGDIQYIEYFLKMQLSGDCT